MDGTMIDNKKYHDLAWIQFCEDMNMNIDIVEFSKQYTGKKNEAILELIFKHPLSVSKVHEYEDSKEALYRELYLPHFKLVDGLIDLLEYAKSKGIRMAIATSAPRVNVDFVCTQGNLYQYFDAIVDSSMVTQGKPSPEVFLKAAQALGAKPENCICFEDSHAGITASLAAGMTTIGIANEFPVKKLLELGAHYAFEDFREIRKMIQG